MKKLKPAGQGHVPQTGGPAVDYRTMKRTLITRYGPDSGTTNYPASRVATGRIPDTDGGLKRYTASTDGNSVRTPHIDRASKYDHGAGQFSWNHMRKSVGQSGPSQRPVQSAITRRGKHKEG